MKVRRLARMAALAAVGAVSVASVPAAGAAEPCPNAEYRTGPSLNLPDCRAYELVTPPDKVDQLQTWPFGAGSVVVPPFHVGRDGESVAYLVPTGGLADDAAMGVIANWERGRRSAGGWSVEATVSPPVGVSYVNPLSSGPKWAMLSADNSKIFFSSGTPFSAEQAVPGGDPQHHGGVQLSDGATATWVSQPTWAGALPVQNGTGTDTQWYNWLPAGGSESLDTVYFMSGGTHTPLDGDSERVPQTSWATYVWKDGALSNAGVLPDGSVSRGGSIPANFSHAKPPAATNGADVETDVYNAVSRDGSSFLFVSPDPKRSPADPTLPKPQLYMYRDGEPTRLLSRQFGDGASETTPIDGTAGVSPAGTAGRPQISSYALATPDHSVVVFSTVDPLTDDAPTDAPTTVKTYRYDTEAESLTYLPELDHALGIASPGRTTTANGNAIAMSPRGDALLYLTDPGELRLWRKGDATLVLSSGITNNGGVPASPSVSAARFAENSSVIFLQTTGPLRGETRHIQGVNSPQTYRTHIYRYSPADDALDCISCKAGYEALNGAAFTSRAPSAFLNIAAEGRQAARGVTPDGDTVVFASDIPLTDDDHNDRRDVYRWKDGDLALVSSGGTGAADQLLYDISDDGEDIFILSRERLVPWDIDDHYDIYDVRVGGGFDPPPALSTGVGCGGDGCQGPVTSTDGTASAASELIDGAGNAKPARSAVRLSVAQRRAGRAAVVAVRVSGPGRLTVRGAGVRRTAKRVDRAGRHRIVVRLNRNVARRLARRGRVVRRVRVTFRARSGRTVSRRATVRFKTRAGASRAPAVKAKGGRR